MQVDPRTHRRSSRCRKLLTILVIKIRIIPIIQKLLNGLLISHSLAGDPIDTIDVSSSASAETQLAKNRGVEGDLDFLETPGELHLSEKCQFTRSNPKLGLHLL